MESVSFVKEHTSKYTVAKRQSVVPVVFAIIKAYSMFHDRFSSQRSFLKTAGAQSKRLRQLIPEKTDFFR